MMMLLLLLLRCIYIAVEIKLTLIHTCHLVITISTLNITIHCRRLRLLLYVQQLLLQRNNIQITFTTRSHLVHLLRISIATILCLLLHRLSNSNSNNSNNNNNRITMHRGLHLLWGTLGNGLMGQQHIPMPTMPMLVLLVLQAPRMGLSICTRNAILVRHHCLL
jgi:hypothetical protein